MNKPKIDLVKVAGIGGVILSLGATLLGNYSNKKEMDSTIEKKVAEALLKKNGES